MYERGLKWIWWAPDLSSYPSLRRLSNRSKSRVTTFVLREENLKSERESQFMENLIYLSDCSVV